MKYAVKYLLLISGSKNCSASSAKIERHSVINCCPVALLEAIEGSTGKWSKQIQQNEEPQGTKLRVSSFEITITIVEGLLQLLFAPLAASEFNWDWPLTRQRNKTTFDDSASLTPIMPHFCFCQDIASPGETRNITSLTCKKSMYNNWSLICHNKHKNATNMMKYPWVHLSAC